MKFYTDVSEKNGIIYLIGYEDEKRIQRIVDYHPYLYLRSEDDNEWRTLDGNKVVRRTFKTIKQARNFIYANKNSESPEPIWGIDFDMAFIHDVYLGKIDFDFDIISTVYLDIETDSKGGFCNIEKADKEITAITLYRNGQSITFGMKKFQPKNKNNRYVFCFDEKQLLKDFLNAWNSDEWKPDIVSGWNCIGFDLPYLVNRITRVLNQEQANRLSPWGILETKTIMTFGKEHTLHFPVGIQVLDYLRIYKKFNLTKLESYSLEFVCQTELGEGKIDYSDYQSLDDLYEKNSDLFYEYNIKDCERVDALEKKRGLLRQLVTLAYLVKTNYQDVFGSVRPWDSLAYGFLKEKNIVVPYETERTEKKEFIGGFVREVVPGMYSWIVSFDFASLYPSIIRTYNISPETFVSKLDYVEPQRILDGAFNKVNEQLGQEDVTITGNCCLYERDHQGFLPALMERLFNERTKYKKDMISKKKLLQSDKDNKRLKEDIQKLSCMEQALKVVLNSGYGVVSNQYFRFFNIDNAEAVTSTGQILIQWVERDITKYLNKITGLNVNFVIGADTDSLLISFGPLIEKLGINETDKKRIIDTLDAFCKSKMDKVIEGSCAAFMKYTNAFQPHLSMKREALCDRGLWRKKKNYILNVWDQEGVRYATPEMKIVGLEVVKSNTPKICRDALKKSIEIIFEGDKEKLREHISTFRQFYFSREFMDIASPTSVHGIIKYDRGGKDAFVIGSPRHVKGAISYNEMLERYHLIGRYNPIYDGDKIRFLSLKMPNPTGYDVISIPHVLPKEFGLEKYIDYDAQYEKTFMNPLQSLTDLVGWNVNNEARLEDFV